VACGPATFGRDALPDSGPEPSGSDLEPSGSDEVFMSVIQQIEIVGN